MVHAKFVHHDPFFRFIYLGRIGKNSSSLRAYPKAAHPHKSGYMETISLLFENIR